jgi:poly-beta-1,6-N-acetyl-D-glucosamine synthase
MMLWLFWLSAGFVAYTYIGYPVIIWLLSRLRATPPSSACDLCMLADHMLPSVSIVMAAFNEAGRVSAKLQNLLAVEYPRSKLEIIVVSDGSTDATERLVRDAGCARLISYPERRGKPHALNLGVAAARAEVIVFTDVRQQLAPQALRHLIATLRSPGVGVASGELVHLPAGSQQAARIGAYWRYEKFIRKAESRWYSTVGTTGALYAIERADYRSLPEDTILDDFEVPMAIVRMGRRAVIEPRALMYDELQVETAGERRRKVRTLTGNYQSFTRNLWLFSPPHNPVWFQFLSHKVFRLLVPYALVAVLLAGWFAGGLYYRIVTMLQLAVYGLTLLAMSFRVLREQRLISVFSVFVELNIAAVVALLSFVAGRTTARWEKT